VDDEELLREVLAEQLSDAGFGVRVAADASKALALLDAGEPVDVLVTDLSMPGMDGLALIRAVRSRCPGLPAVLLTGYAGDGAAGAEAGGIAGPFCLPGKPVRLARLVERILGLLGARE
jgi:CheY-like chemotaxis protein